MARKYPRVRSPYVVAAATAAAAWLLLRVTLGTYLPMQLPCSETPPDLDLQVQAASARAGRPVTLWYKASFTNRSCAELKLETDFLTLGRFRDISQRNRDGFFFEYAENGVWTADEWSDASRSDAKTPGGTYLYATEWERESIYGTGTGLFSLWLAPNAVASNIPSYYAPYVLTYASGAEGHEWLKKKVTPPRRLAPDPPDGHRLLGIYTFARAGKRSLRLVFKDEVTFKPRYRYQRLPSWLVLALEVGGVTTGTLPAREMTRSIEIRSPEAHLEVAP